MNKSLMLAAAGALVAVMTTFAPVANAGYGHGHHHYKTVYYKPVYSYGYQYVPVCKWVFHYGHYKKVCW